MSNQTAAMLENLGKNRKLYQQNIMDLLNDYAYREERYKVHFSVVIVYSKSSLDTHVEKLKKHLRKTDTLHCITENMICVIFDAAKATSYVKAAENLYKKLKSIKYQQHYFIATTFSADFDENYLDMLNHLFDRLYYTLEHNCYNNVNYDDYII